MLAQAKFTNVDRKSRTIALSIKAKEIHEEAEVVSNYRTNESSAGTSLGDLLKEGPAEIWTFDVGL